MRRPQTVGRIIRQNRGEWTVLAEAGTFRCTGQRPTQRADRRGVDRSSGAPVVGDEVCFVEIGQGRGRIVEVRPRHNVLARRAAGPRCNGQLIAANVDQLVAVFAAAEPPPSWAMLDRYLVIAEAAGVPAIICITKIDLADETQLRQSMPPYEALGYPVLTASIRTNQGVAQVRERLKDKWTVLAGKSGVGKTSLLNALEPGLGLRVAAVSTATGKGQHTTTATEAFALTGGGRVIDTPGVRELGLWDVDPDELPFLFPEMRSLIGACRFGGRCTHVHEDDCAVKTAVRDGAIHPQRYHSYLKMRATEQTGLKHEADTERYAPSVTSPFICRHCGRTISSDAAGTQHRNHCPHCLWSVHVDVRPGDRAAACSGLMAPIAVWVRDQREWSLVHRCEDCGAIRANRVAGDDSELKLMSLAVRALAEPPFPLEQLMP